jgi:hypothetical protein
VVLVFRKRSTSLDIPMVKIQKTATIAGRCF